MTFYDSIDEIPRLTINGRESFILEDLLYFKHDLEWPSLIVIALDHLSIPLINSEYERVFSLADYLITAKRNHMKENIIETIAYLRGWQVYF
jgi:hypothetical protein